MVATNDTLHALVEGAYAAALDDRLWEPLAWRIMDAFGGACCGLAIVDLADGTRRQVIAHRNLDRLGRYIEERMDELDPQVRHVMAQPGSRTYLDTDYLDLDDPATAEHVLWLRSNGELGHHMSSIARLENGRHVAGLTIHRSVADGHTPPEEQRKLAALMPQVAHAIQLGLLHGEKLTDAYWDGLARDRPDPTLLLDGDGRVLRLNPAMERLLCARKGIDVVQRRLRVTHPTADAAVAALVGRVVDRERPAGGAVRVAHAPGRVPLVVTAYPLPRRARMLAPAEAAALVTVVDPADPAPASAALIRQAFDLTPREAELASLLSAGHAVESAATVMAIGIATARLHLRRIMQKTHTTRQAELVRLLVRFG